ncbi:hypothetical protein BGX26_010538 [Mortierella sp. AD094]|nr:hypothetical protein BGX26_010538 [Mortierella sp. AD094]
MTEFSSLVSKFAHEKNGESSNSDGNIGVKNDKKRTHKSNEADAKDDSNEDSSKELVTQARKSLRLSSSAPISPLNSRTISADSIKTKPHHKRAAPTRAKTGRNPGYSAPEVYSHLALLPDIIDYDLDVLFVGINPGVMSSQRSHHFSNPTNHFWPCLSDSGLLPPGVRLGPDDDQSLPGLCNMGLTNLVDRPSRMGNELSVAECRAAAPVLTAKIKKYRPRFVCFVSKQAWDMYAGVGLGLQTAWVSWYDEPEDESLVGIKDDDDDLDNGRSHSQNNLDMQGYRLAPYFERGPSADNLKSELEAEGVPSSLKREPMEVEGFGIKSEPEDEKKPIKAELDDIKPVKLELDEKNGIKAEEMEDKKIKLDSGEGGSSSTGHIRSRANESLESKYRGGIRGSRMFVMPSTSGRVTQYRKEDKLAYFKQLAELVRKDRRMRGVKDPWSI